MTKYLVESGLHVLWVLEEDHPSLFQARFKEQGHSAFWKESGPRYPMGLFLDCRDSMQEVFENV